MARSRATRSARGFPSVRRRTSWDSGPNGILSPASTIVSGFPTGVGPAVDGLTLIRTRASLSLLLLTSSVAQGGFQWAFGIAIVTAKAFGIGATAIPGPLTEIDWDGWLMHLQGVLKSPTGTIGDMGSARVLNFELDSKAMRKFPVETRMVGMFETVEVGTASMHAELRTRQLVKLP